MKTYAKMKVPGAPGFIPPLSVGVSTLNPNVGLALTDRAWWHYECLLSMGFPPWLKTLYIGVAAYLGEDISLLDFKILRDFDVFSQIPERYVQEGCSLTLLEDTYSFLRWNGLFVGAREDGFGQRCFVQQRVLSCTTPLAEHEGDFIVLSRGETVRQAFDTFVYSRGWHISGILFEQRSDDRLLSVVLHISGRRVHLSPYG